MIHFDAKLTRRLAAAAGVLYLSFAAAQPPAQPTQSQPGGAKPPTLEDRVAALERGLASVTTRFDVREAAVPPSQSGVQSAAMFETRVSSLERSIGQLQQQLQSVQRAADSAQRAARLRVAQTPATLGARRNPPSTARDALLRAH